MIEVTRQLSTPLPVGSAVIDRYSYDEEADVLYLTAGRPRQAADDDDSLEGDTIFFDRSGAVIGVTMISPRCKLEHHGVLGVTLPRRGLAVRWERELIESLLVETLRYA